MRKNNFLVSLTFMLASPFCVATAQQGYEFEVYDTHLTRPRTTELELNTNFVASGRKQVANGVLPTDHMVRSSVEIGGGFTRWLEGSIYIVAAYRPGTGASYVGNRARVTAAAPVDWKLPVELGLTQEVGYARPGFAESRWTYEFAPMIGKTWGAVAFALNPALERGIGGHTSHPLEFEPRARVGYGFGDEGSLSVEYYAALGPISSFDPRSEQTQLLFAAIEKELSTHCDLFVSFGHGLTISSDRAVLATRLEYRFNR